MLSPIPPDYVDSCLDLKPFACCFKDRLDFPRSSMYFFELLSCCLDNLSLEARYSHGEGDLAPDAFFYHLKEYDMLETVRVCNELLKLSFDCLKNTGWKEEESGVYVAVDFSNEMTWACKDVYVHKKLGKKETGSSRVHRYATVALVSRGFRFTLGVVPVKNTDPSWDVVRRLLLIAKDLVCVDLVLLDREFYDSDVFDVIESMGLEYVVHVRKSKGMKRAYIDSLLLGEREMTYTMNKALAVRKEINVYFKEACDEDDYDYMVITSNKMVTPFEIDMLFEAYETRWNIENTYKECKDFKAKTNTTQHTYRLILYMLRHLLVNLLMIIRHIEIVRGFSKLDMKNMMRILLKGVKGSFKISRHLIMNFR